MMEKSKKISMDDLQSILEAKANAVYMRVLAEKAQAEKMIAELQAKNITLITYLKYGLFGNDSIDGDGNIISGDVKVDNVVDDTESIIKEEKKVT